MRRVSPPSESRPQRLLRKYEALAELCERKEEAQRQGLAHFGGEEAARRKARFHALALEFPGCLRELDSSASERLRRRAEQLRQAPEPGWAPIVDAFHATLRDSLALKRWLAERLPRGGPLPAEVVAEFARSPLARLHPADASHLERHLHPPGGRLQALVWAELEGRFGRPRAELEREVFG